MSQNTIALRLAGVLADEKTHMERFIKMNGKAITWAKEVAAELGEDWSATPGHWSNGEDAHLTGPDGQKLHVRMGGYQLAGRVAIAWSIERELTKHERYQESSNKSITVSDEKTATAAAKDITRRLLPGLADMVASLAARKQDSDDTAARLDRFMDKIAGLLNGEVRRDRWDRDSHKPEVSFGSYDHGGKVKSYYDDTVEITVRLPWAQGCMVAEAIGTVLKEGE